MSLPLKHMTVISRQIQNFKSQAHQQILLSSLLQNPLLKTNQAKQIHAQIILNPLENDTLTVSKLIAFYALNSFGDLHHARLVFERVDRPNRFMYNTLIRGYSNSKNPKKALVLYKEMTTSGVSPNEFTLPFVLKACISELAYWVFVVVHGHVVKMGLGSQVSVQNGLINGYGSLGNVLLARKVFDGMHDRTSVSWNLIIGGYANGGFCKESFVLFDRMRESGFDPDGFTYVNLLSGCSSSGDLVFGRFVHLCIEVLGIEVDVIVRNALLDMYAKCGDLRMAEKVFNHLSSKNVVSWTSMVSAYSKYGLVDSARLVFDRMPVKNVVSWNSMISCYVQENRCREALKLFKEMDNSGVVPNEGTLLCVLSACSQIGDLIAVEKIHDHIRSGYRIRDIAVYNSLIDTYAKCGALKMAMNLFNEMPNKNLVSWNTIIGALASHGCAIEAVNLYERMEAEGLWPDEITFTGLLSSCSHGGLVEIGRYYFDRMSSVYGISREIEHYACMVDLLGRGGLFDEAVALIAGMPMKPDFVIWSALLGACRTHGNVEIGKLILKQLLESKEYGSGLYVLLSNLFTECERWKDARNIWKLMNEYGISKSRAISFIEIEGSVHEFMVDDKKHEASGCIYLMLYQPTDHLRSNWHLCNLSTTYSDVLEM